MKTASLALIRSGMKNQMAYLSSFITRNLFLIIILYVFQALWKQVYAGRTDLGGFTLAQMVWYLSVTEAVMLSRSSLWMTVQDEVKDGTVAYGLTRPLPYTRLTIMRFLGEGSVRILPLIVIGIVMAQISVGTLNLFWRGLPAGLLLMAGALIIAAQFEMLIGLAAFGMEDVTPLYWIFQKIIFIFGGMFFPVTLYPEVLADVLRILPFSFISYWPASVTVTGGSGFLPALAGQLFWILVLSLIIRLAYRRSIRIVEAQGG